MSRIGWTEIDALVELAAKATEAILAVYTQPFEVKFKQGDDPVTEADARANAILCEGLAALFPGVPVVAEESDPAVWGAFREASAAFFVDPLDGTRDFVKKNGEFAVMVGLAREGRAALGLIQTPADGRVFVGGPELGGSFEVVGPGDRRPIAVSRVDDPKLAHLVLSRSRPQPALEKAAARLGIGKATRVGSAGLKALRVATGEVDLYAHLGQAGSRWDTCAPEAIAISAGGEVTDSYGRPIDYRVGPIENEAGVVVSNGRLHAAMLAAIAEERARGVPEEEG